MFVSTFLGGFPLFRWIRYISCSMHVHVMCRKSTDGLRSEEMPRPRNCRDLLDGVCEGGAMQDKPGYTQPDAEKNGSRDPAMMEVT